MTETTKELKPKLLHSKEWYAERLRNNICVVVFEKKDGTERTMMCTTQSAVIEEHLGKSTATGKTVTVPETQVRVFDIQKKEWRSFTTDSVIMFFVTE